MKSISYDLSVFFFENPTQEFYESQVKKITKASIGAVNSNLKILAKKGYLLHRRIGRMNFYQLNREDATVKQMKKTYTLSMPFVSKLKELAKSLDIEIYIYGSVARGEDTEKSDVDLLVIGKVELVILEKELSPIRKLCKREIKASLFTRLDWISMSKKDPAFFERVEKDKIRLV